MAYPWAFMKSAVESAFRAAVGSVGTAGGLASGVAGVPAYHALVVPAAGVGWNTVVGPPLALLGQKPSPSRADGFWVTIVDPERAAATNELAAALSGRDPALVYGRAGEAEVRRYLTGLKVPAPELERALGLLRQYHAPRSAVPSPAREKTDPLRRGVDVLLDSAEDTLN